MSFPITAGSFILFIVYHRQKPPRYKAVPPSSGVCQRLVIKPEVLYSLLLAMRVDVVKMFHSMQTAQVRPHAVAAVLRNITFTEVQ